ncbi:LuxR family transcriptional regulator [Burkholderia aenigmatica]|uniref:LuxR family transcriptional regulator n=1 Tax=Burkholderia aenigmatica TaxID=2015348 RepID=A0ABY6XML0_9BURK|nr:LuxR C-terminal-related transcriptional regulator [Burkholderia aenigmatica]VWC57203.1 LuxR family transcriptional regulator [Burkholderia aenigmatica]VWC81710.1 LuxR family transcriptional regulator [Burkholderia aenigmatica]
MTSSDSRQAAGPADADGIEVLVRTKLAPASARGIVSRIARFGRLARGLDRRLTLVCAPAGYGKTTVLAEWRHALVATNVKVAWVSLDQDDDNASIFSSYVVAAIVDATGGVGGRAQRLLRDRALIPLKIVFDELLNELEVAGTELVLMLDDYDRLASPVIHDAMFELLRYAPSNLHVVLSCRSAPALPLSYFESRDELVRVDEEDLRFDDAETRAFFERVAGKPLSADNIGRLRAATEGWVSGLQLAALALRDDNDAARVAEQVSHARGGIAAYLNENVMTQVPDAIRHFLLCTAVLDRMTPALCDALTGRDDAVACLEWLSAHNLFIRSVDGGRRSYRYHALFLQYLREELTLRRPDDVATLHRRASVWYAAEREWPDAVRHALAAGDFDAAAGWVEACAMKLIAASDVRTVLDWVSRLPEPALAGRLRLRIAHVWALALSMQMVDARRALEAIEADIDARRLGTDAITATELLGVRSLIAGLSDRSIESLELGERVLAAGPPAGSWVEQIGQTTLLFGLGYAGRLDDALDLRTRAERAASGQEPLFAHVYRQNMSGLAEFVAGRLHDASKTFETALRGAERSAGRLSAATALSAGYLSAIYYEWNDWPKVREAQRDRFDIAMQACSLGPLLRFMQTAAVLQFRSGNEARAHEMLDEADHIACSRQWLRLRVACMATGVRLHVSAGKLTQAHRVGRALAALVSAEPPEAASSYVETWQMAQSARARLLLADARANEAAEVMATVHDVLAARGFDWFAAQAAVLRAVALEQAGQEDDALAVLAPALEYGQGNGLVRTFVDEGAVAERLTARVLKRADRFPAVGAWYLRELVRAFDADRASNAAPAARSGTAGNLSAREVEILDYVARGLSNKEIARALRVAPETIKWHLKNIFEKLNVTSRIQAVRSGLALDASSRTRVGDE